MSYTLYTAPVNEPVTLDDLKNHLVIATTDHDALLALYLRAARNWVERITGRALMTQTWERYLDGFPSVLRLERSPVASVTHVKYTDTAGAEQTLTVNTDYLLDLKSEPARITPAYNKVWPSTRDQMNCVNVRFVAGVAAASSIPPQLIQAMLLLCGHWFEHREEGVERSLSCIPFGVGALVAPYCVSEVCDD